MSRGLPRHHSQYGVPSGREIQATVEPERLGYDPVYDLAHSVEYLGDRVSSRYGWTQEMIGGTVIVRSGTLIKRDGINYALGWMEMLQLLAGTFDPEALRRVAPKANHSLFTYSMAYGPRIVGNVRAVIEALREDPTTRQAVLFIASPTDGPTPDLPCTLTIQFLQREGAVNAIVSMRSWDLCRGLPYDLMMFSGLLEAVARCLDYTPGSIMVTAGSTHVYEGWRFMLPRTSDWIWHFDSTVPREWVEIVEWAKSQIPLLSREDPPSGVEIVNRS